MRHCVGYADTEGFDADAQTERETGEDISGIDTHIGCGLVVVCQSGVEFFGGGVLEAEDEMAEEI